MTTFVSLTLALAILFLFSIPYFKAIADMHEINYQPIQHCGPRCVIETKGFDSDDEAQEFAAHVFQGKAYQIKDSRLYFVDYQVTELEAGLMVQE